MLQGVLTKAKLEGQRTDPRAGGGGEGLTTEGQPGRMFWGDRILLYVDVGGALGLIYSMHLSKLVEMYNEKIVLNVS